MDARDTKLLPNLTPRDQDSSSTLASVEAQRKASFNGDGRTQEKELNVPTSQVEEQPSSSKNSPPNGGVKAWLQVLAAFIFFMNSWGLVNTFGVFQTFYKSSFFSSESNSSIAWIGSIRAFVLLGSPALYGPVFDLGYVRLLPACGAFAIVFGIMMTSLCTELWQFILAQGLVVGLGSGALFLTAVAIIPTWFTTRTSSAMGIAASGSSIGGVIYPIIFRALLQTAGFGWAVRTLGFITLATNTVACALVQIRHAPEERRAMFDANLFRDMSFNIWCTAWFFGNMGLYIPYFFIQDYANKVVHQSVDMAFWTLTAINAASVFGRIIPGQVADAIKNPILVITVCTAATTILAFCWIAIKSSIAGLFVFCALYGFCSGAFVSLSAPGTVQLAPSMKGIGTRLGTFNGIGSLGLLIGNPVAGAIVEKSWTGMQIFCGAACVVSLVLLLCLKVYLKMTKSRES